MPPPNENVVPKVVEVSNGTFRLGAMPDLGGSLTHLVWTPPTPAMAGCEVDLMRRAQPADLASGNPSRLASFAMVPFTNRIDRGEIPVRTHAAAAGAPPRIEHVPINRPAQNAAIHGFGRLARWSVAPSAPGTLHLGQTFAEAGNPYAYEATQIFTLAPDHVLCTLSVTNRGDSAMPFGIGFHPWFDRTPAATLAFNATQAFRMDDRDMPLEAIAASDVTGSAPGARSHDFIVAARTPFDTPISGWDCSATLTWPEQRTRLTITAGGALTLVHIFSPADPAVFCVEPVSHLPDVINRRHLAAHGDMTLLAPGQTLSGAMRLEPSVLA